MKNKLLSLLLLAICPLTLWSCAKSEVPQAMKLYEEFLAGQRSVRLNNEYAVFAENKWIRYAFFDMNKDGIPELHVRGNGTYSILTCRDGELVIWASPNYYAEPLNNGAIFSMRDEGFSIQYHYIEYDFYGNEQLRIDFGKARPNDKGVYDENSNCYFEDEEVSMQEWNALTEKYFAIGSDKIEWINVEVQ